MSRTAVRRASISDTDATVVVVDPDAAARRRRSPTGLQPTSTTALTLFVAGSMRTSVSAVTGGTDAAPPAVPRTSRAATSAAAGAESDRNGSDEQQPAPAKGRRSAKPERLLGRGDQRGAGRVAVLGLFGHRLADHRVDRFGQFGSALACARWLLLQVRPGHRQPRAAGERGLAGQTLVEETAERVDIRAAVDRPAFDLLGGEVGGRAHGAALARWAALLVESSGQSEVGEIDMLARIEQHVGGLDVPMDETFRVRRIQGVRDLADRWRARGPGRAPPPRGGAPSGLFPRRRRIAR